MMRCILCLLMTFGLACSDSGGDIVIPTDPPQAPVPETPVQPQPNPETSGAIQVTTSTTGGSLDVDGYTVAVDDGVPQVAATNGILTVDELEPGAHGLELAGVAPNCTVQGENPISVSVLSGETAVVTFSVVCAV